MRTRAVDPPLGVLDRALDPALEPLLHAVAATTTIAISIPARRTARTVLPHPPARGAP